MATPSDLATSRDPTHDAHAPTTNLPLTGQQLDLFGPEPTWESRTVFRAWPDGRVGMGWEVYRDGELWCGCLVRSLISPGRIADA